MKILNRKPVPAPTKDQRIGQAQTLSVGAVAQFRQAADDLEIASQLKAELADEIAYEAEEARAEAIALDARVAQLDQSVEDDLTAALRIRDLFAL